MAGEARQREMGSFYDALLAGSLGDLRANPDLMTGLLHQLEENALRLTQEYDQALKALSTR